MAPAALYPVVAQLICCYSSLAANLAMGMSLEEAVAASKAYVAEAIAHGIALGSGCGPTHHFVDLYRKAGILE